jgi:hypothetical protein
MSDKKRVEEGALSPKLYSAYINDQPLLQLATKKKHTLVCRRHRPFVFDSNSKMTMGRIIKGANERLAVKTVSNIGVGPKRSVDEQLAINVCVGSQKCSQFINLRGREILSK